MAAAGRDGLLVRAPGVQPRRGQRRRCGLAYMFQRADACLRDVEQCYSPVLRLLRARLNGVLA